MTPVRTFPTGYPITAIMDARRLRSEGRSHSEIAAVIEAEYGSRPSSNTISVWTSKRAAATQQRRNQNRRRTFALGGGTTGARLGRKEHSPEFKFARMRALRDAGLKYAQIARVMTFDYDAEMTEEMVRYAFQAGRYPRSLR